MILGVDELAPALAGDGLGWEQVIVVGVQLQVVLVKIGEKLLSAQNLGNLHQLVVVVAALEEGLSFEDHASEHATKRPNVQGVVVSLQVDEEFGSFEISGSDTDIVLLTWMVELGETPVDESQLAVGVVNHDVVRLDISVHDALAVAEIEGLEDLIHIEANVEIVEALVKLAEVSVTGVDELGDNGGRLRQWVSHDVNQLNDVDAAFKVLQNLDLSPDLVLLDYQRITKRQS